MKKQTCIICGKPQTDGIIINNRRICRFCEERITKLSPGNDFYEFYKNSIKKSIFQWKGAEINCQDYHL